MSWKRVTSIPLITVVFMMAIWVLTLSNSSAFGQEREKEKKDLPQRAISVSPEYTGVVISEEEENVSVDLIVTNGGRQGEDILLSLTSIPKGWEAWVKTYSFGVTGVHVESDKSKNLTLKLSRDKEAGPGKYTFDIQAQTEDGKLSSKSQISVTVEEQKSHKKVEGVKITTSYPVLRGPTDAKFEFSVEVDNKLDKDTIFSLSSQGPKNWEINFKPAYEDKFISSLRLKGGQSQTMAVAVKPHPLAKPGEYPILIKVNSPEAKGEATLTVVLTGTYKLNAGTANGLLSMNTVRGKEGSLSFYVQNNGSATLNNVHFLSFKPENWKVAFNPERIDTLGPEELKQVEVSITPTDQALVGDYSVGLTADAGKVSKAIELRITVRASTAWGWIGIGIIVLVMAGLVALFIKLGRR
jgi:uncharacterized membrane protein